MEILDFVKEYWTQIVFFFSLLGSFLVFAKAMIEATKCSLRNDILDIFDRCKEKEEITTYQLESIEHSSELYFKLNGNSFVKAIVEKVRHFKIVD